MGLMDSERFITLSPVFGRGAWVSGVGVPGGGHHHKFSLWAGSLSTFGKGKNRMFSQVLFPRMTIYGGAGHKKRVGAAGLPTGA